MPFELYQAGLKNMHIPNIPCSYSDSCSIRKSLHYFNEGVKGWRREMIYTLQYKTTVAVKPERT